MQRHKLKFFTLPFIIFITTLLNFVFVGYGLSYIYVAVIFFAFLFYCLSGLKFFKIDFYFYLVVCLYILYILFVNLIDGEDYLDRIVGCGMYLISPVYWFVALRFYQNWNMQRFVFYILPLIIIISFLGIIQFHFSPNLFGLLDQSRSNNILWASEANTFDYLLFFRSTSIFSSPQVYGLFLILSIFLIHANLYISNWIQKSSIFIIFIGAAHSGNKMIYAIFFLYLIMVFIENFLKSGLKAFAYLSLIIPMLFIIFFAISNYYEIGILTRIIDLDQIIDTESEGRLSIYKNIIANHNWIIGEGPGKFSSTMAAGQSNYEVAESFLLQFVLENGILFFLVFVFFLIFLCLREFRVRRYNNLFFLLAFLGSMIFVHAHTDPVFFIFWGATINIWLNKGYGFNIVK